MNGPVLDGIPWGPSGRLVYERTYRRDLSDGRPETWPDTVRRVVRGNLSLVEPEFIEPDEARQLSDLIGSFSILPAGRHLWMSGAASGGQLFNCHVAGWDADRPAAHFTFTCDQLMQGGGVGANYSNRYLTTLPAVATEVDLHVVCDPQHPDHEVMVPWVSERFVPTWPGVLAVEDSREGWVWAVGAVLDAAWGQRTPQVVLDLSRVRPRGAPIRAHGGLASGPETLARLLHGLARDLRLRVGAHLTSLDAMQMDHLIAQAVVEGGARRSARMSIKSWSDPDVTDFIRAKSKDGDHWTTNLSVEIDRVFLADVNDSASEASVVLDHVIDAMLLNGEPGLWNWDLSQAGERREVVATNPCGEVALEPWENCNLGHVNLANFAGDIDGCLAAHRLIARFLLRATLGPINDPRQGSVLARNHRIGVGHLGFQEWLVLQGIRYSESHTRSDVASMLEQCRAAVRNATDAYASELGIPTPVKATAVAPTGTVAKLPGVSEGIHPIYARHFLHRIRFASDDPLVEELRDQGVQIEEDLHAERTLVACVPTMDPLMARAEAHWGAEMADRLVESADEIELCDFFSVQAMYQIHYADNAVSATANIPRARASREAVRRALLHFLPRLKGTTVMVDDSRPQAPYERLTRDVYDSLQGAQLGQPATGCMGDRCPLRE